MQSSNANTDPNISDNNFMREISSSSSSDKNNEKLVPLLHGVDEKWVRCHKCKQGCGDLRRKFPSKSNFCFLLGSVLYLAAGIWDIIDRDDDNSDQKENDDYDYDYDADDAIVNIGNGQIIINGYQMLYTTAALCFFANGIIDLMEGVKKRHPALEKKVALLLICGGFFDSIGGLLVVSKENVSNVLSLIAAMFYMSEAMVAMYMHYHLYTSYFNQHENYVAEYQRRSDIGDSLVPEEFLDSNSSSSSSSSSSTSINTNLSPSSFGIFIAGDVLFFSGSLLDLIVGICILIPSIGADSLQLLIWALISDILWCIDGLLYVLLECYS